MSYTESNLDRRIQRWFKHDNTYATLHRIRLKGRIRSLVDVEINFEYPITVFAGKNGCGKTTLLALAACAYHNANKGFRLRSRKTSYYTYSDFFIQTQDEVKPEGISVWYKFLHNNWKGSPPGMGNQQMRKRQGGKWASYEKRVRKNVVYLGIDRIVPTTEKRVYKSYLKNFVDAEDNGWYGDVEKLVGKILGKSYSEFRIRNAKGYSLQLVKEKNVVYSGFNMGAGEKALFELISIIYQCSLSGHKAVFIIDEIELGLHEVAQKNLIQALKELCDKFKIQVICTTHSATILDSVPPAGRFYIDKEDNETTVLNGISGAYAAGRLADINSNELDVYVEDSIAETLLKASFSLEVRQRIGVIPIGSAGAVCRQMASAYMHPRLKEKSVIVLDGDQQVHIQDILSKVIKDLELSNDVQKTKFKEWAKDRILFIPGSSNPEKWIIEVALGYVEESFSQGWGIKLIKLNEELKLALEQDTHSEFFYLSKKLSLDVDIVINDLCRLVAFKNSDLKKVADSIEEHLG